MIDKINNHYAFLRFGSMGLFILLVLLGVTAVTRAQTPLPNNTTTATGPMCRYGANALENPTLTDLPAIGAGWYMNFRTDVNPPTPNDIEYMQTITIKPVAITSNNVVVDYTYVYTPSEAELLTIIDANPAAKWIISNEPDSIYQDNLTPKLYASAYHELYHLIKNRDTNAQIIAGSIIQATTLRLAYLDKILVSYYQQFGTPMPTDGWSIHNYILPEIDCNAHPELLCWGAFIPWGMTETIGEVWGFKDHDRLDIFIERIVRFRQWLFNRGYGGQPVYLTEYGILLPADYADENLMTFPPSRVNTFMTATFDYLRTARDTKLGDPNDDFRLVQQWAWFSTTDSRFNGTLYTKNPYILTEIGQNYDNYTAARSTVVDLYPRNVQGYAVITSGTAVTVTISATIANSGNLPTPSTGTVYFYNGHPQQGGIQIGAPQTIALSGCGDNITLTTTWPNMTAGTHTLYVQVMPGTGVTDDNTANNITSGQILVATEQIYLPIVSRGLPAVTP